MRALFSVVGGEGHLQQLLPVARAGAAAGHGVVVTGARILSSLVNESGLPFVPTGPDVVPQRVPLQPVDLHREERVLRDGYADRIARVRAADLLPLCSGWRPDVVVRDETDFAAAVVAEGLGIPHATVLVIAAGSFVRPAVVAEPLDRLRTEFGLAPDPDLVALGWYLVLSPFPPSFRSPADPLPATGHPFRSSSPPGTTAEPSDVGKLDGGRPTVYVTLGTIFNTESGDLFARVLAGVRTLPVEVVVAVGRTMDPGELGPQPGNVRVERYIPQSLLLPRCAAVVSHGGSGTVLGALAHGLPLVCIPMGADQPLNAARCTALGVGVVLDAVTLTSGDARAATSAVLGEPGYRRAATRLQAEIAALPDASYAVTLVERLAVEGRPVLRP